MPQQAQGCAEYQISMYRGMGFWCSECDGFPCHSVKYGSTSCQVWGSQAANTVHGWSERLAGLLLHYLLPLPAALLQSMIGLANVGDVQRDALEGLTRHSCIIRLSRLARRCPHQNL